MYTLDMSTQVSLRVKNARACLAFVFNKLGWGHFGINSNFSINHLMLCLQVDFEIESSFKFLVTNFAFVLIKARMN